MHAESHVLHPLSKEEPNDENGGRSQKLDKRANTYHALARTVANMHAIQK